MFLFLFSGIRWLRYGVLLKSFGLVCAISVTVYVLWLRD